MDEGDAWARDSDAPERVIRDQRNQTTAVPLRRLWIHHAVENNAAPMVIATPLKIFGRIHGRSVWLLPSR